MTAKTEKKQEEAKGTQKTTAAKESKPAAAKESKSATSSKKSDKK